MFAITKWAIVTHAPNLKEVKMSITVKEFLKNKNYRERFIDFGYAPSAVNIRYLLKFPEFDYSYFKLEVGKERILIHPEIFFSVLEKRQRDNIYIKRPDSKQISNTVATCWALKGDCSKCHYSNYVSIKHCKTYEYVKYLEASGGVFSPPTIQPDTNKYLYLVGKINHL